MAEPECRRGISEGYLVEFLRDRINCGAEAPASATSTSSSGAQSGAHGRLLRGSRSCTLKAPRECSGSCRAAPSQPQPSARRRPYIVSLPSEYLYLLKFNLCESLDARGGQGASGDGPITGTGAECTRSSDPMPSWPTLLKPQQYALPFSEMAQE